MTLGAISQIKFSYWNSGKTPLWIKFQKIGLISSSDWNNIYKKSSDSLLSDIKHSSNYDSLEIDFVINLDSTIDLDWQLIVDTAFFAKHDLEDNIDSGEIVIYPYIFFEYNDCFGYQYNAILIHFHQLLMPVHEKKVTPITKRFATEQYDWGDADN